ncbi:MAG: hypothetical protein ACREBC_28030 [Pyrinomonadaceae bacterium]
MAAFRIIVALLPQILLLMLIGGKLDLLGGWNHTDSAFGVLITLFLVTPVATAILLIVETVKYRKVTGSYLQSGFAVLLFLEALAIDSFILSQVRMH